jgi:hypothetical protein
LDEPGTNSWLKALKAVAGQGRTKVIVGDDAGLEGKVRFLALHRNSVAQGESLLNGREEVRLLKAQLK